MIDFNVVEKLNCFKDVKFDEEPHLYTRGSQDLISVTTLIKKYETEKDWDDIAQRYAIKNFMDKDEVLDMWEKERNLGSSKGTEFHKLVELWYSNKLYTPDYSVMPKKLENMFYAFWLESNPHLIPVRSEFVVASENVAGMIDMLFWNKKMQELQIWDWKTNKKIATHNKYQSFTGLLSHLDECEYNKYSLQLSTYKYIFEKYVGIPIGNCYIGWFFDGNDIYKLFKIKDLSKEAEIILNAA
jgi:hypothetical protein